MSELQVVEVERIRLSTKDGSCKAFATLRFATPVGSLTVDNFRLMEPDGKPAFVACPDHKAGDKFYKDVTLSGDLPGIVFKAVMAAYQRELTRTSR